MSGFWWADVPNLGEQMSGWWWANVPILVSRCHKIMVSRCPMSKCTRTVRTYLTSLVLFWFLWKLYFHRRKCLSVLWEPNSDKSIIFALEVSKIIPILTRLMTLHDKSLLPWISNCSENKYMKMNQFLLSVTIKVEKLIFQNDVLQMKVWAAN